MKTSKNSATSSSQPSFNGNVSSSAASSSFSIPCGQREAEQGHSDRPCVTSQQSSSEHSDMETGSEVLVLTDDDASGKHFGPDDDDDDSIVSTPENRTPVEILVEETPSSDTPSSGAAVRGSPMDIVLAESPPSSPFSSASSSSSSSSGSVPSPGVDTGFGGNSPLVLDHSSFYRDGSSKDWTLEQPVMAAYAPEEQFIKNLNQGNPDQGKPAHSASRPSNRETQHQFYQQEALHGSKETALEWQVLMRTTAPPPHREFQQKPVSAECSEQKDSVPSPTGGTDALQESSPKSLFQGKVLPHLRKFLLNHKKCKYWALLHQHCPSKSDKKRVPCLQNAASDFQRTQLSAAGAGHGGQGHGHRAYQRRVHKLTATAKLLEDHLPHQKVFTFLRAVVKQTIPAQLIGCPVNMAVFLRNIRTLISSGKFEKMCLGQLMKGMKVKRCEWLGDVPCLRERQHRVAQLVWWLVVCFLFPVIRTFFYLTDTTTYRNRVFYYRKRTWLRLKTRAVQEFRKATCLKPVSQSQVSQWLATGQALGVSALRFLPKARSLRPIVNMSGKPKTGSEQKKSINKQLNKLFQVLTSEKALDPNTCGCSVFGMEEIYQKLKQFKQDRTSRCDDRKLYFVKSDISNCFDCIQQRQLFQMIKATLSKSKEQTYMTRKFASVHLTGKRLKRVFHTDTTRLSLYQPDFVSFLRQRYASGRWSDIIVVDMTFFQEDNTASLLQVLSAHLFKNVIKIGGRHYLQTTGISQGSVMSTLLASIYLAHLENAHLSVSGDELLIRRMDDYLLLTPHRAHAERFVHTMGNGFPDFNCFTSVEKMLTNFPVDDCSVGAVNHVEGVFPWCGLVIDTHSLEVSVDYSRYSGLSITDTATFDTSYRAGQTLSNKLLTCLGIKCHAIFFDPGLNSKERILLNAYQALRFVALLFHAFVVKLPSSQRVESNPGFFSGLINQFPSYVQNVVTKKLKQAKCAHQCPISFHMLQWLSADALLSRLHPYPGYKPLKKFLRAKKLHSQKRMGQEDLGALREVRRTGVQMDSGVVLFRTAR
ncbi:telomerase reverse transcriptase-like [Babylonia areolata]|uniref:telomerase reverse transcriptase-like n=1 Tax=Babylonia areolata TaxID=304850 RepID=UPI003FD2367C